MLQAVVRPKPGLDSAIPKVKRLFEIIQNKSLLKGRFKLASGAVSDYYLDMKPTTLDPEGISLIADIIFALLLNEEVDAIGGLELGAVPIITAVCQRSWPEHPIDGFIVRKEKKGHGTDKKIDGNFRSNTKVILFDDVTTKGGSVLQAVRAVREQNAAVTKVITVVDRLEGAAGNLAKEGVELIPLLTTRDLLQS